MKKSSLPLSIVLLTFTHIALAEEKCHFRNTANLTGQTRFENGSYLYHNRIIPHNKVTEYNYRLTFPNLKEKVEPHIRGCVCNSTRYCIKLCCDRNEYFNEQRYQCEPLPNSAKLSLMMEINSERGGVKTVNVLDYFEYLVGLPCSKPETLSMELDQWKLWEDGYLHIDGDYAILDTVNYCLTTNQTVDNDKYTLVPMSCPIKLEAKKSQIFLSYVMAFSVFYLVFTVLIYLFLKQLRGNMIGKITICYLISLSIGYSIISFINISENIFSLTMCSSLGFICYYFFMAAFLWLSVLCYYMWTNFKEPSVELNARKNLIRFIQYSIYAWVTAGILTTLTMWAQWSNTVPDLYKPGIDIRSCWLDTNKWSAAIYFYFPILLILLFNIVTFGYLTKRIIRVRRDVNLLTQNEKSVPGKVCILYKFKSALVILRLFLILGISWIMDILSYCLREYGIFQWLLFLTDFFNAIQGILIFILFVFKRNVLKALKNRLSSETAGKPRRSFIALATKLTQLSTISAAKKNTYVY